MRQIDAFVPLLVLVLVLGAVMVSATPRGHPIGVSTIVRCQLGHLFTTVWVPGASLKAVRLGWFRIQQCPVGHHLAMVTPVREADLTAEERRMAARYRDTWVP
jgi:hypothetical protein